MCPKSDGAWSRLRSALVGNAREITAVPLGRAIWLLALPMMLEGAIESVFSLIDVLFVARLSTDAVAAVGVVDALTTLVFAAAAGLSMAITATVARRIGERDADGAARATVQAIALGAGVAIVLGLVGGALAPRLLAALGASPSVVREGAGYARLTFAASFGIVLLTVNNAALRGAGDAASAMRALWLATLVSLALDPCLIFGLGPFPRLGLTGAAIATAIGRSVGIVHQLRHLASGRAPITIRRQHLVVDRARLLGLARLSIGGVFGTLVVTGSWMVLLRMVAGFGSAAVAGYTIAVRIILFALQPAWGIANAAATLVGQHLGARRPELAARATWATAFYNLCFLIVVALAGFVLAPRLVGAFTDDAAAAAVGSDCLRVLGCGYAFFAYGMVIEQAFYGAGEVMTPTLISLFTSWLCQLPLAWLLARTLGFGTHGVFVAMAISESVGSLVGVLAFRRGRWQRARV